MAGKLWRLFQPRCLSLWCLLLARELPAGAPAAGSKPPPAFGLLQDSSKRRASGSDATRTQENDPTREASRQLVGAGGPSPPCGGPPGFFGELSWFVLGLRDKRYYLFVMLKNLTLFTAQIPNMVIF